MARLNIGLDPYAGKAESDLTSKVIRLWDSVEYGFSWRTTSGTTSAITFQISNEPNVHMDGTAASEPPENSWVDDTEFASGGNVAKYLSTTDSQLTNGVRFGRFVREISNASIEIDFSKRVDT